MQEHIQNDTAHLLIRKRGKGKEEEKVKALEVPANAIRNKKKKPSGYRMALNSSNTQRIIRQNQQGPILLPNCHWVD